MAKSKDADRARKMYADAVRRAILGLPAAKAVRRKPRPKPVNGSKRDG